jgi:hypothetical protein
VTVNGQTIPYDSTYAQYDLGDTAITGTYSVGSTLSVVISHTNMTTVTQTLTVPTATLPNPANFTFSPALSVATTPSNCTVTPPSAWPVYGSIWALLYSNATTYSNYYSGDASLTGNNGYTFKLSSFQYGSPTVTAQYVIFTAWTQDKADLSAYGTNGSSPSRLRVFAPDGCRIGNNL